MDEMDQSGFSTLCGSCGGSGCDWCMPDMNKR